MRGPTLLFTMLTLALSTPGVAQAQQSADAGPQAGTQGTTGTPSGEGTGGSVYGADPRRVVVPGRRAVRLDNGYAAAPASAPARVREAVWAANEIVGKPYRYGGGHNRTFKDTGYDCSGTISYALRGARLLKAPMASGGFMSWGKRGKGKWITVYANEGHAYVVVAGLRLDTSAAGERVSSGKGPRWRTGRREQAGFAVRHPKGF